LKLSRVGAVLSLVHSGVEVDKISPVLATKSRLPLSVDFGFDVRVDEP